MNIFREIKLALVIGGSMLLFAPLAYGQYSQGSSVARRDMAFRLELLSPLSTSTNKVGDKFNCKVLEPSQLAGAVVTGHIANIKESGKVKGKSQIDLRFDTITTAEGSTETFNATVEAVYDVAGAGGGGRADDEGTVKGRSTVKRDVAKIGGGAAVGAILGGIFGGPKGAAIGATIGAGAGATTTLSTKGPDLEFKQGTQFTVRVNSDSRPVGVETDTTAPNGPGRPEIRRRPFVGSETGTPRVELPSTQYRTHSGERLYSLSVPANWRLISGGDSMTFAPDGAYGSNGITHGIIIGTYRTNSASLSRATDQYISDLLQANTYITSRSSYSSTTISGRSALSVTMSGVSPTSGRTEVVTIITTLLAGGKILHLATVAPQHEYSYYQGTFNNIVRSVRVD